MAWSARSGMPADWGMHPRDLFLLADILEASGKVEEFQWGST